MLKYVNILLAFLIFFTGCAGTSDQAISSGDNEIIPPVLIKRPDFIYPEKAQDRGIEGNVDLYGFVDNDGTVRNVKIKSSSNNEYLDEAAKNYVMQMKYKPAQRNNNTIGVWLIYNIKYDLLASGRDFHIDIYLVRLNNFLSEANQADGNEREEIIQEILELNEQYFDYVRRNPQHIKNQDFIKILKPKIIKNWKKYIDLWPLTFILCQDLLIRFPESSQKTIFLDRMMNLMLEDLIRAQKIDQRETIKMKNAVSFANDLKSYLNNNFKSETPEVLLQEIDSVITLY